MSFFSNIYSKQKIGFTRITTILGIKFTHISKNKLIKAFYNEEHQHKAFYKFLNLMSSPSNIPVAEGSLRKGQLLSIKLLKELKEICERNKITFWIDFGSLLGAVRHKGYIPWDSDVDTSMLREDYLKVIPLLKEKYKNTDIEVREYGFVTHLQIRIQPKNDATYGVDIFPVDRYSKGNLTSDEMTELNNRIKKATDIKRRKFKRNSKLAATPDLARKYIEELQNKWILMGNKPETDNPTLFFAIDYPLPYQNLARNYNLIFPLKTILFEGEEYPCPNKTNECLELFYGKKYMEYPQAFKEDEDKINEYLESIQKQ